MAEATVQSSEILANALGCRMVSGPVGDSEDVKVSSDRGFRPSGLAKSKDRCRGRSGDGRWRQSRRRPRGLMRVASQMSVIEL